MATKKLYFKIGEACKKLDIQPYVLRYWETEFPALSPNKSKSGQRVYTTKDLQVIGRIKELLYEEGFTIAGAKKKLEVELKSGLKPLSEGEPKDDPGGDDTPEPPPVAEASVPVVDQSTVRELESLRKGVQGAIKEANSLLEYLDSDNKSS